MPPGTGLGGKPSLECDFHPDAFKAVNGVGHKESGPGGEGVHRHRVLICGEHAMQWFELPCFFYVDVDEAVWRETGWTGAERD